MISAELQKFKEEYPLKRDINKNNYYSYVKSYFNLENFFIAGGSVVDLINNNTYNDIDLFFETEHDFNAAISVISSKHELKFDSGNAVTFETPLGELQLVKLYFGTPTEIMNTFDINKSRIALTSTGIVRGNDYDKDICIDYLNFTSKTPGRIERYRQKGFNIELSMYSDILNYLIKRKNDKFKGYYKGEEEIGNRLNVISKGINSWNFITDDNTYNIELSKLVIDFIDSIDEHDAFTILDRCSKLFDEKSKTIDMFITILVYSETIINHHIRNRFRNIDNPLSKEEIMKLYPEYFL